jgi:hypothetical protein
VLALKSLVLHEQKDAHLEVLFLMAAREDVRRETVEYALTREALLLEYQSVDLRYFVDAYAATVRRPHKLLPRDGEVLL